MGSLVRMKNAFARLSESHYQNPRSQLRVPLNDPDLRRALANAPKATPSTYCRTSAPPEGEKLRHNEAFAERLKQAGKSKFGLALDGARLTTTQFAMDKGIDPSRIIVPNPCTARFDGLEILRKRASEPKYEKLTHVFLTLEKLLALRLPAVDALEGSISTAWLDLMNSANNKRVVRDAILKPFFKRKWLANQRRSYFALTLSFRGIKKTDYRSKTRYWRRKVRKIAKKNGYKLKYIQGVPSRYRNGRSNMMFLSFEIPNASKESKRQTKKRQK